jgi:hypothetical protein
MFRGQMHAQPEPQVMLPVSTNLHLEPSTCSLSGNPPFTITIIYTCITSRPIWVLISLFSEAGGYHIRIRDPSRGNGRIGVHSGRVTDDDPPEPYEDAQVLRLDPEGQFKVPYTFTVDDKSGDLRHSDVWQMKEGNVYFAGHGERRCWWMYADEMEKNLTETERRRILVTKGKAERWRPEGRFDFTAVA